MDKLATLASAMGFSPGLRVGNEEDLLDRALLAALRDDVTRSILEEALKISQRDRELLLGITIGIQTRRVGGGLRPQKARHLIRTAGPAY